MNMIIVAIAMFYIVNIAILIWARKNFWKKVYNEYPELKEMDFLNQIKFLHKNI